MAEDREAGRQARRQHPVLFGANIVSRLGVAVVPLSQLTGHPGRVWALALLAVFGAGLVVSSVLLRRTSEAEGYSPATADGRAYRQLRHYVRSNHPALYSAEMVCWLGVIGAGSWRLFTHDRSAWATGLFLVSVVGAFVCFVLFVRRDPEGRL